MDQHIAICQDNHILTIRMNRPDKKNALTAAMYMQKAEAVERAETDMSVRTIVFLGSTGCFTAGNDLKDFPDMPPRDKAAPVYRFIIALARSTVPIVAAVDGLAIGIGTTMLLHCDMAFATEKARFQLPFINLGLSPEAGATYLLPKLLSHTKASELIMTCRPFYGVEAHSLGLVNQVCAADALEEKAMNAAADIALKPPRTLRRAKALLKHDRMDVERQIGAEILEFSECLDSAESKEALSAFAGKRKPDFSNFG
ncbi:MAG: enoyl-CoA hydratase [Alphaproteobacteria bacterium]